MSGTRKEEFKVSGEELLDKARELIAESSVRRITVTNKEGKVIADIPVAVGAIGIVLAPALAALGAASLLLSECTIAVEREEAP